MIVQVGPFPGPLGGVAVYLKRLKECLDAAGLANQVWDIGAGSSSQAGPEVIPVDLRWVPWRLLLHGEVRLVHYHLHTRRSQLYIGRCNAALLRGRRKLLTIHGPASRLCGAAAVPDRALLRALNSFDAVICVRAGDRAYLQDRGVTAAIREIPAFIAPRRTGPEPPLPAGVGPFLARHGFIITANGSALRFHDRADLYGLDLCIELTARLRAAYPERRVGFIFGLAEVRDGAYLRRMEERIALERIEADFLLLHGAGEFYPVIQSGHLFIRPSNTDGYSVSLAEAIFLKVPAIASDAAERPPGTLLFHSRDGADLFHQVERVLRDYPFYRAQAQTLRSPDYAGEILQLYEDVLPKPGPEPGRRQRPDPAGPAGRDA